VEHCSTRPSRSASKEPIEIWDVIEDRCDLDYRSAENNFKLLWHHESRLGRALRERSLPGPLGLDGDESSLPSVRRSAMPAASTAGSSSSAASSSANASGSRRPTSSPPCGATMTAKSAKDAARPPRINGRLRLLLFLHNNYGKLFLDRPHKFRMDLSYTTPFKLFAGSSGLRRVGRAAEQAGLFQLRLRR